MKAVMVMFDSLNKHFLPNYGCDWIKAPNFKRLANLTVTFDRFYAGSLPCIPARRELHTGRYNFLHRSWGPLEPFDDSMVELLKKKGVYTHLTTDHGHYFEDGGATYHNRYNTWEFIRGQEGDHWKGQVKDPEIPETVAVREVGDLWRQDWVNRGYMDTEEKHPMRLTFNKGIEFIETNREEDQWFLQIECFDPHEPYFTHQKYKDLYPHEYKGKHFDWPDYNKVTESPDEIEHINYEYAALVSMCDTYLGKVLDAFDQYNLWEDTLLIVNTDHGFMLGEKEWWGKNIQPLYNEIVNVPFFLWDPRYPLKGERTDALAQMIDVAPSLLDFFGVPIPESMQGKPLGDVLQSNKKIRDAALFGIHGGHINITDGRYVYMKAPVKSDNQPLYEYTLMPTHMNRPFAEKEFSNMSLSRPFDFTKGCQLLKLPASSFFNPYLHGNFLFDLEKDPEQLESIEDLEVEVRLINSMSSIMTETDAPEEQFDRMGIPKDEAVTEDMVKKQKEEWKNHFKIDLGLKEKWESNAAKAYASMLSITPFEQREKVESEFIAYLNKKQVNLVTTNTIMGFVDTIGTHSKSIKKYINMYI